MKKSIIVSPEDCRNTDWVKKAADAGFDTLALHSGGRRHDLLEALAEFRTPEFRTRCANAGLSLEYEEHAAETFLPSELRAAHPEYFACGEDGVRQSGERAGWCPSAPGMRERIADGAEKLARALRPSSRNYYFWGADSKECICRCLECAKFSRADLNVMNANMIAEGILRADPQARVALLAYTPGTFELPEKVVPHEALFLEFAPFHRHYDVPLSDPADEVNSRFRADLLKLLTFFPAERVHVLEYWLDVSYFSCWRRPLKKIGCPPEVMRRDLEFYYTLGIRNFATFAVMMDETYFAQFGDEELYACGRALNELL